ncbi:hypothetical protein PIROE2DRAFT_10454 [Piromyces sp. E2]|nr:hypothetical protein PIROE2DRAFT_10454 [Piromyces sp. E2]|eukprot:OUM63096.1 hypothetical protein PIROE2DRAFT_10454 [Piromyces sp. E2]
MSLESYTESLESLLNSKMKSDSYDIIMYNIAYKNKFNKYLEDLNQYLDNSEINGYIDGIVGNTTLYDKKPSSIPLYLDYDMLYCNKKLLDYYEKDTPKTWFELYDTSKYIVSEEKIGEWITKVTEAMEQLMEIKEGFGDDFLRTDSIDIRECLMSSKSSNCLFVKTWNNVEHSNDYEKVQMPGREDGISGTIIDGYNIGINKKISDSNKKLAAKVIKYFASFDFQKDVVMEWGYQSGLKDLYDDNSICQSYSQCQTFKNIQYIMKPIDATSDYPSYSRKFRNYLLQYLMNIEELSVCLNNIQYLTRVFYEDRNFIGNRIMTYIIGTTDLIIIYSYCYAHTKRHIKKFQFFNNIYWFFYLFGLILMMSYGFTGMGELTNAKCFIRPLVLSVGFTLSVTLICIRMLVNFPESNQHFVQFMEKHSALCVIFAVVVDVVLNLLVQIDPFKVKVLTKGNIMYNTCKIQGNIGHMFTGFIYIYKIISVIVFSLIIFIEWNIKEYKNDVRLATASLFISVILYIIYAVFNVIDITGYREQFIIPSFIAYLFGVSNFILFFFSRFFIGNQSEEEKETSMILQKAKLNSQKNLQAAAYEKYSSTMSLNQTGSGGPGKKMSLTDRLVSLHNFGDEIKKSSDLSKKSNSSSTNDLSHSRSNNFKKYSRSSNNISLGKLDEISSPSQRRVSQIDVIPENRIAEIYNSTNDRIIENHEDSDDVYINRNRTRSYDNVLPNFNRITRINSTPNKKFFGAIQNNVRSTENFSNSNSRFNRKGSNVSFSNNPITGNSNSNLSRKSSTRSKTTSSLSLDSAEKQSQKISTHSNVSAGVPYNAMSTDFISYNSSNIKNSYFDDSSSQLSDNLSNNNKSNNKKVDGNPSNHNLSTRLSFKSNDESSNNA